MVSHEGALRIGQPHSRYFTDVSGNIVYLTGSHTWNNGAVDIGPEDPPKPMDYEAYLDWMAALNHNFMRLWQWELTTWHVSGPDDPHAPVLHVAPHPWLRTGPGTATDGKPRFDLTQWDPVYFERLRERVAAARKRGIYTAVMLFEGWGIQFSPDGWRSHPFHAANNINGMDGDRDGDGAGLEIFTLGDTAVTALQEAYVAKVIHTLRDLDNVLFEISNENHPNSTEWQYRMIDFIHTYEQSLPLQHPVGMTFQYKGGSNEDLFNSPADWISPNKEGGYIENPPVNNRGKIIINDTDHLWGIGGNSQWVWKSFLRGLNPIFMDPYQTTILHGPEDTTWMDPIRRSMGYTRAFAKRMDLATMPPRPELASSTYCLANPTAYLVYLPEGGDVSVDLSETPPQIDLVVEWFDPATATTKNSTSVRGGAVNVFRSVFESADAVLYIYRAE
jgi:hypothetical protein